MSRIRGPNVDISLPELQAVLGTYCLQHLSATHFATLRQATRCVLCFDVPLVIIELLP